MTTIGYLLQTTLCLGIFYAFYYSFLKKEKTFHFNRIYLIITLIFALVLPFIHIPFDLFDTQMLSLNNVGREKYYVKVANEKFLPEQSFNWFYVFNFVYLIGVTFNLYQLLKELSNLRRIKMQSSRVILRGYSCILCKNIRVPFSFFQSIYIPAHRQMDEKELDQIIDHESVHINRKHSLDNLLFEIIKIFLWMNPFVHLYKNKIRDQHEFIADEEVIKQTDRDSYCNFLINYLHSSRVISLVSPLAQTSLKTRFIMMQRSPTSSAAKWKYAGAFPLGILSFLIFSCSDTNQNLTSSGIVYTQEGPLEIMITGDLQYQVKSEIYSIDEVEDLIIDYQAATKDPLVNVRATDLSALTVGDISPLGDIAMKLHLRMEFYTEN